MPEPGPSGIPSNSQNASKIVQPIANAIEYGSINVNNVPRPMRGWYFCAKAITSGMYGISGVMMLVKESPMR